MILASFIIYSTIRLKQILNLRKTLLATS